MSTETVDLLMRYTHRFRERIGPTAFLDMRAKLERVRKGGQDLQDRRHAILFSTYHLLFSGAVAESNIAEYIEGEDFPSEVAGHMDPGDDLANIEAWEGTAFENTYNIIGALAFSIVVLFFFEGFCKALIGEDALRKPQSKPKRRGVLAAVRGLLFGTPDRSKRRIYLEEVLKWLRRDGSVDDSKIDTALFLYRYRNGWHNFGRYDGKKMSCKGLTLRPGQPLPILKPPKRDEMLAELLDLFLEVDAVYSQK